MYLFLKAADEHAYLYLSKPQTNEIVAQTNWSPGRELSQTALWQIQLFLSQNKLDFQSLEGLAVFAGPGRFTHLRIMHTLANALAFSLQIPITNASGDQWLKLSWQNLKDGRDLKVIKPRYGQAPNITQPRK